MTELFPYQVEGAKFLAGKRRALLADKPRVGKTPAAVGAADIVGAEDILEITTGSARRDHARIWRTFQTIKRQVTPIYSLADRLPTSGVIIVSWSIGASKEFKEKLKWHGFDVVIPDESHRAKNKDAERTKVLYGEKCDGDGGIVEGIDNVWPLSGTPAPNHYGELWTMLRALMPETILGVNGRPMSYSTFTDKFCRMKSNGFDYKITGSRNHKDLKARIGDRMLRRTLQDVRPDVPDVLYDTLEVDASDELAELKALEREDFMVEMRGRLRAAQDEDERQIVLDEIERKVGARLRRLTGLAKVPAVAEWLAEQFEDGLDKIVIFAVHHDVIDKIAKLFPGSCVTIDGRTSAAQRDARKDRFMRDPKMRGCIGQIQATGEAIDLSAADQTLFIESSYVPGENNQAALRVVNVNKAVATLARFVSLPGSIDEDIQRAVMRKTADIAKLFG